MEFEEAQVKYLLFLNCFGRIVVARGWGVGEMGKVGKRHKLSAIRQINEI